MYYNNRSEICERNVLCYGTKSKRREPDPMAYPAITDRVVAVLFSMGLDWEVRVRTQTFDIRDTRRSTRRLPNS